MDHGARLPRVPERGALFSGQCAPSAVGPGETLGGTRPLDQELEPSLISRRSFSTDSPPSAPLFARRRAASKRLAFLGERSRWAVSISPASSSAGIRATSLAPLRRTITTSWSSPTCFRNEASLSRRLV